MAAEQGSSRAGEGVYTYETRAGTRYYFKYRKSDGRSATKRGFSSPRAARRERERIIVSAAMGEQLSSTETFGEFFDAWLRNRRPYLEPGTYSDYEVHGRLRLAPLRPIKLTKLATPAIEDWLAHLADEGRYAPKTINNALATLVACLNDATRKGKLPRNPAARIQRLPAEHIERDYLRLHEIPAYLDSCAPVYRPLAELLIATGLRIGEALALSWTDVDFENRAIRVLRSGKRDGHGSTKGDRFRSVDFGPRLETVLLDLKARQHEHAAGGEDRTPLFSGPGRWPSTERAPRMDRNTVSRAWHKHALVDAGLRDMPLHSLRHTAAAAWLTTGKPLMYVQRQLGHASITTTERCYGHLEATFLKGAAAETEAAIWGSVPSA
jgi:integrase